MKVLAWSADPGIRADGATGAAEHVRELSAALARAGHAVTTSFAGPSRWPRGLRTLGARVDAHRRFPRGDFDLVWERFHPASDAGRRARVRWIEVDAPGDLERRWPAEARPRELERARRILHGADRVWCVSRWLAGWATAVAGVPSERVGWLPNGVPPHPPGDREGTRRRLGLDGPTLVFVGSLHRWQGADLLPDLLDGLPEFRALVVGDGSHPPRPHPRLLRVGRVPGDAVPDLVAAGDVGVAPYDPLGPPWYCPLKVLRYRAEGLPVVATDVGDCAALGASTLATRSVDAWVIGVRAALAAPRVVDRRTWDDVVRDAFAVSLG